MRLICPNCDAQYEVDSSAIPEGGRDVQCSNCGHAWFQMPDAEAVDTRSDLYREPDPAETAPVPPALAQTDPSDAGDPDGEEPSPPPAMTPVQRSLDDSVLAVLREEAERETAARRAEAQTIEVQGDLGLPPPVSPMVGATAVAADSTVKTDAEKRIASMKGQPVPPPRPAARRDLLPDIEEINSTLRPSDSVSTPDYSEAPALKAESRGFKSGFALVLLIVLLGMVLYLMAPKIAAQIPAATDAMTAYVAMVDSLRAGLDGLMRKATGLLNGLTGG